MEGVCYINSFRRFDCPIFILYYDLGLGLDSNILIHLFSLQLQRYVRGGKWLASLIFVHCFETRSN